MKNIYFLFLLFIFATHFINAQWQQVSNGLTSTTVYALAQDDNYIYAGTSGAGVFRSSDNGDNWEAANSGMNPGGGWDMLSSGSYLFCANGYGVYRSTNNGDNWTLVNNGLTSTVAYRMTQTSSYIFVGTSGGGIFRTSNFGENWEPAGFNTSTIYALLTYGTNIFAGISNNGVHLSTDNGNSWTAINEGLTNLGILCLVSDDTYLYTGTSGSGVYRRAIDNILSVKTISDEVPLNFNLQQNYPNPFNPTTTISWQSPVSSHQTLKVYDVLGNEVATLVDEYKFAGSYEVKFDASGLNSGVYFYKLQAGSYSQIKKLILLK